jgi:hypothetical protein
LLVLVTKVMSIPWVATAPVRQQKVCDHRSGVALVVARAVQFCSFSQLTAVTSGSMLRRATICSMNRSLRSGV